MSFFLSFFRFVCQQPRMDAVSRRAGHSAGDRGFFVVWQVCPGPPLPHRILHAGGVSGRREIQKGSRRRRTLVSPAYQRRRRTTRAAGNNPILIPNEAMASFITIGQQVSAKWRKIHMAEHTMRIAVLVKK